jgi:Ca2+-binding RTX toxin-like protein
MKTISITKNQTSYYEAKQGNATYVLEKGVSINSSEFAGLVGFTSVEDRNFVVKGEISTMNGYGIHVGSNENDGGGILDIAKSGDVYGSMAGVQLVADDQILRNAGKIGGEVGVKTSGEDVVIQNSGFITGKSIGVDLSFASGTIRNEGMITGGSNAISTFAMAGDQIKIVNKGEIGGAEYSINLSNLDGSRTVIVNHGEIGAKYWAIQANFTDATEIIRNRGEITSQVWLGNGDDIFDGRGGTTYYVDGGGDDDLYIIDDPLIKLGEQMNSGIDTVRSSITWKLGSNFENLTLTGKNSITGTGSDDANRITGNAGQNTLFGLGGIDIINGGKGDDTLNGGAAADHFVFATGTGHDTIADFQDGLDLIDITAVKGITTFDQVAGAMVQNGVNVDIDLGNGDMLTVANTTLAKLTAIDFAY